MMRTQKIIHFDDEVRVKNCYVHDNKKRYVTARLVFKKNSKINCLLIEQHRLNSIPGNRSANTTLLQ